MEKKKRKALESEAAKENSQTERSKKRKLNSIAHVDTPSAVLDPAPLPQGEGATPQQLEAVRREDEHFKLLDPEKEKRTIFVGNLPSNVKEKAIKKMFQVRWAAK